jgi:hypothetical protein
MRGKRSGGQGARDAGGVSLRGYFRFSRKAVW